MIRKDREKDETFALEVVKQCEYAALAMLNADGTAYCIPISHVLYNGAVYFHSAIKGKKCENIEANSRVCLTCVTDTVLVPERLTTRYKSAVIVGDCFVVNDVEEKKAALFAIAEKYAKSHIEHAQGEIERHLKGTQVYKITPLEVTGKGNL